jgi:hypothetical protein
LLTGLLGRPQMFSPIRRSILYFVDRRLLMRRGPYFKQKKARDDFSRIGA